MFINPSLNPGFDLDNGIFQEMCQSADIFGENITFGILEPIKKAPEGAF